MKIKLSQLLFILGVIILLLADLLFYARGKWYYSSGYIMSTPYASQANAILIIAFIIFLILFIYRIKYILKYSAIIQICLCISFVTSLIWCIISIVGKENIFSIVIRQYAPTMGIFLCILILGTNEELYKRLVSLTKVLLILLLVLTLIAQLRFLTIYGFAARSKSSAIYLLYSDGLFAWLFYCFNTEDIKKDFISKLGLFLVIITSVLTISRGYIIIALLCCFLFYLYYDQKKKLKFLSLAKFLITIILFFLLIRFFLPDLVTDLVGRLDNDTRSGQYVTFFEQVEWWKLLIGQGMSANYSFSRFKEYLYIDNCVLVMLFRYGIAFVGSMVYLFIKALKEAWKKKLYGGWQIVLIWLLVINGMSVYFNYRISFAYLLVIVSVGRIIKK